MMHKPPLRGADCITSILLILLGVWIVAKTLLTFPMKDTYAGVQNVWYVSPALFPLLISSGIIILGIVLLINAILEGGAATLIAKLTHLKPRLSEGMLRFLSIVLVLVAFVYLNIPRIDFFLSTLLCLTVFISMYYLDYPGLLQRLTGFYAVGSLIFTLLFFLSVGERLNRAITKRFIEKLSVTFQDEAFASGKAGKVENSEYYLYLNFNDPSLLYSDNRFKENADNEGAIDNSDPIIITLSGDTFTGSDGEDFVAAGKVSANLDNVAPGLTAVITRQNDTELQVQLTGKARRHLNADDVDDLTFRFQDSAFSSGKAEMFANASKQDVQINFKDPLLTYSAKALQEAPANDGTIDTSVPFTITLNGDQFSGEDGEDFVAADKVQTNISRVAPGLTMRVVRIDPTTVQVTLTGAATAHADANDVKELLLKFKDDAFITASANRVKDSHRTDLKIDFADTVLTYSADSFRENSADDGSIDNNPPLLITLSGDTLSGEDGENFVDSGKVTTNLTEVAPGLEAEIIRTSPTELQMTLAGRASAHADAQDVEALSLTFQDSAFVGGNAAAIIGDVKEDLRIDFIELALTYSNSEFQEAEANDGSIDTSEPVLITLTGDTFSGEEGEDMVATGKISTNLDEVAPGLEAVIIRNGPKELQMTLRGKAVEHDADDSVSNLTVRCSDAAFTTEQAENIARAVRDDVQITFHNPALIYSKKLLKESEQNDGSLDNSEPVIITLEGGTFTGSDGDDFVTTGKVESNLDEVVPGLTMAATRTSPTAVQLTFGGAAVKHERKQSIENLAVIFQDAAFTSEQAAHVDQAALRDLRINFSNPVISYSHTCFQERGDEGKIDNSTPLRLTLTGDTFTGSDGDDFVADGKVLTNIDKVASGLQAKIVRRSPTELQVTLTGQATHHADAEDVKRLAFVFQDAAFTSGDASIVVNADKSRLQIDFSDLALNYSKTGFKEAAANEGTIDSSKPLMITLCGDTLSGEEDEDFVSSGKVHTNIATIAPGLIPEIVRTGPTDLRMTLAGAATQHSNAADVFINGPFRYSMDILAFMFFLVYVGYCRACVRRLGTAEPKTKFLTAMVISVAVPLFVIPLFKYALLVPFPVEGGGIEVMNIFWYSAAIKAIRKVIGPYLLLLGIFLIFMTVIAAIYFKFMRRELEA